MSDLHPGLQIILFLVGIFLLSVFTASIISCVDSDKKAKLVSATTDSSAVDSTKIVKQISLNSYEISLFGECVTSTTVENGMKYKIFAYRNNNIQVINVTKDSLEVELLKRELSKN